MQIYYTQDEVHNITLQYIDTIPVAVSLCILKSGYLFAPCERGNQ
jgi:splicing factor 3B subunit 3